MRRALGWRRDLRDPRDYHAAHPKVSKALAREAWGAIEKAGTVPSSVDLRGKGEAPIMDQGQLGSCTAHAAAGMVEHFLRATRGDTVNLSRLYIYKATRLLAGLRGDSGAELRDAMRALVLCGAPDERVWPYTDGPHFDADPPSIVAASATAIRALAYFRLDPHGAAPGDVLLAIRRRLASGLTVMFGTTVFSSFPMAAGGDGVVPMPSPGDRVEGGHALLFVGYDDARGALLFRNSWGTGWGDHGYGWLPYDYVLQGIASDFWTLTSESAVDPGAFG